MYYFIGIKGTGMAALATMIFDLGNKVSGSDLEKHFFTQDPLDERNIPIYPFSKNNIKDNQIVIIGNAFLEDFEEVIAARSNPTVTCYRYHEFLGRMMNDYKSYSVSGSHGKTTTTGMIAKVLGSKYKTAYLIGDGTGFLEKNDTHFVLESCEFRRHFLAYFPDKAIITNVEIDHVDYFKDDDDYLSAYQQFLHNIKDLVIICGDDSECLKLKPECKAYYYGFNNNNDYQIRNLVETSKTSDFDLYYHDELVSSFTLSLVGKHLVLDAVATIVMGLSDDISPLEIEKALNSFSGVKRRYVVEEHLDNIFIDDYAHHPTEVRVTIEATKTKYPNKKIIAIFKPHRVSRVFHFRDDFKNALNLADKVYLCDFTSIDDKEEGIDIDVTYLSKVIDNCEVLSEDEAGARVLSQYHDVVFLFMSSKDIYFLATMVKDIQEGKM